MPNRVRITEIFFSIQGESQTVGWPTVFVRLTGCPLRCVYCDTSYAFQGGELISIPDIFKKIETYNTRYVTVTGGEPLAQKSCIMLLKLLCDSGYAVSLETSGALSVSQVDSRVIKVMDLKTPSSGESEKNLFSNLELLTEQDQVKFVICNRADYQWAKEIIDKYHIDSACEILMSPSFGQIELKSLAEWILQDQLHVRLQIQLHKLIWGDEPGR
ncbi:MAG: 7-carboxy-7-deazaguanine synthase QueE [Gammaproteobacteria bacterium]|nr:7-carboxy-7-deazaguanine synthase QueE [Gammaproteobacteria bacterium]